jgi:hypothetical protein
VGAYAAKGYAALLERGYKACDCAEGLFNLAATRSSRRRCAMTDTSLEATVRKALGNEGKDLVAELRRLADCIADDPAMEEIKRRLLEAATVIEHLRSR